MVIQTANMNAHHQLSTAQKILIQLEGLWKRARSRLCEFGEFPKNPDVALLPDAQNPTEEDGIGTVFIPGFGFEIFGSENFTPHKKIFGKPDHLWTPPPNNEHI